MTKKERQKILKAIDCFLDDNPDKWTDGIDELYLLVHGVKWSSQINSGKGIDVYAFLKKAMELHGT